MPFPPKKPEDEKKPAPAGGPPKPGAPAPAGEKPTFGDKSAPAGGPPKPSAAPGEPKPAGGPAPAAKPAGGGAPKAAGGGKGGGNSAPETPGQGVPERKQAEQAGKKEPESDNAPLPKEANEAKKAAQEPPKGLASVATMTKPDAEKAASANGSADGAMKQMMSIIEGLAKLVKVQQGMGVVPTPGGTNTQQAMNTAKTGMMPKPGAGGLAAKPGMPGRPPQPVMPGGAPGAPMPVKQLTMEQITGLMGIIDAASQGRISRQGAAHVISAGFGVAPDIALGMVMPDEGQAAPALGSPAPGAPVPPGQDPKAINSEEEEMEGENEEFDEGEEEPMAAKPDAPPSGKPAPAAPGAPAPGAPPKKRRFEQEFSRDSADDDLLDAAIGKLEAKHRDYTKRIDALELAREIMRSDEWDEDLHPRDESGKFSSGGGGGGGGAKKERDMKSVPHVTVDRNWQSKKPEGDNKPERVRVPDKVYRNMALQAEAEGNRAKADRLHKLADAVQGERKAVKERMRAEVKAAQEQYAKYPKEHPNTPKQGKDEYYKTNAHPENIERLKKVEPKTVKYQGGGINDTMKVTMHDGSKANWKPTHGERHARSNVEVGTYYIREAAASSLARALGVQDLVPAVVAYHGNDAGYKNTTGVHSEHGPFGPPKNNEDYTVSEARDAGVKGSLHAWAPGTAYNDLGRIPELEREAVERARVFDYITGNSDRHGGNLLITERDGKHYPVLIDNGLSFNTKGVPDRVTFPPEMLTHAGLLDSTRELIKKIDVDDVAKTLKASGLDREASKLTIQRLLHLKDDPDHLDSGGEIRPHFVYSWGETGKMRNASRQLEGYKDLAESVLARHDGTRK